MSRELRGWEEVLVVSKPPSALSPSGIRAVGVETENWTAHWTMTGVLGGGPRPLPAEREGLPETRARSTSPETCVVKWTNYPDEFQFSLRRSNSPQACPHGRREMRPSRWITSLQEAVTSRPGGVWG